jgi:endonuclease/exonuclease/phosphatase family metal-dependent hydrolase
VPLKLLTWNIQAAIGTARFSDYLTRAHRQVFHTQAKASTLETIAETIRGADLVCLQEVDLGGRRAGYRCQANAIAERSGHDHLAIQENRVIRGVSRHGNAILSRHPLSNIRDLKLPGRVAGRGCLIATVEADKRFDVACVHLSLGRRDQALQLEFLSRHLPRNRRWVVMGDFNCSQHASPMEAFLERMQAHSDRQPEPTYPSWRPLRDYDHILTGPGLKLGQYQPGPEICSDHLNVTAELEPA